MQPHFSTEENERLKAISKKNQALVYGKQAEFWQVRVVVAHKNICANFLLSIKHVPVTGCRKEVKKCDYFNIFWQQFGLFVYLLGR